MLSALNRNAVIKTAQKPRKNLTEPKLQELIVGLYKTSKYAVKKKPIPRVEKMFGDREAYLLNLSSNRLKLSLLQGFQ